jgi:hypothetical protein
MDLENLYSRNKDGMAQSVERRGTGWKFEVRFLGEERDLSTLQRPNRLWGPPSLLSNGTEESFPEGKASGA